MQQVSKMTIYIDLLFIENFILNFIILYATGIIAKEKVKFYKISLRSKSRWHFCYFNIFYTVKTFFEFIIKNNFINSNGLCIIT